MNKITEDPLIEIDRDALAAPETFSRADYVSASFFGDVALPKGSPAWLASAVEEQVRFAQRLPGTAEWTIGQAGGGSLGQKSRQEQEADAQAENVEEFREAMAEVDAQRERDRWAEEMHSFGNVEMTGAEWSQLGDDLHRDTGLRRWLIERLRRDGRSEADANAKATEIADVATIMGKPESQLSADERSRLERAKTDPTFAKVMPELNEHRLHGVDRLGPTVGTGNAALADTGIGAFALDAPLPITPVSPQDGYAKPAPLPAASAGLTL